MFDEDLSTVLTRPSQVAARATRYVLTIIEGPDRGRTFDLGGADPERSLAGKGPVCAVRLSDAHVSRRHAAFDVREGLLHIVDQDSTNGTIVNGLRVVDAVLCGGEVIRMGETALRLDVLEPSVAVQVAESTSFGGLVGESVAMRALYAKATRIAASEVPVLIEGETGTGKEVLAEAIHEKSSRAAKPFVVFDCTAVAPNLVESELFGHERGAFTGAVSARKGVFEQAHEGTLLVDEIGDLDLALQPKLLRCLERGEVRRVGGDRWIKVNVRILAATRRDLDREVQDGRFRDDLFFRLAVARIELPPLRQRRSDIGLLVRHFWRHLGGAADGLPYEIVERFERDAWPGNVRELANAVARYQAIGEDTPASRSAGAGSETGQDVVEQVLALGLPLPRARARVVAQFERRYLQRLLAEHGGSVARAAAASGLARRYFNLLLARYRDAPDEG